MAKAPKSVEQLGAWAQHHMGREGIADLPTYLAEYRKGRRDGLYGGDNTPWQTGTYTWAYGDAYLDAAAGREIWHYTYCDDPDECLEH